MADPYPLTPVIRLPSTRRTERTRDESPTSPKTDGQSQYIVSDTLFIDPLPLSMREPDIFAILQSCMPIEMKLHDKESFIRFQHSEYADRAYTIFNGFTFTNGAKLKLRMYRDASLEPEACGDLLQIKNLPLHMDDNSIYDLLRPFGPLNLCKPILEGSQFRGTAFVQFFAQNDSERARKQLHGRMVDGCTLTITSFVQPASDHPQVVPSKPSNSFVDYANLYVKNLDLAVTNDDLFAMFRKFGRIVSARVMSNPENGLSKGYGFVSFSKPEEASAALCEMNNKCVHGKPLLVAYHEPKKSRSDRTRSPATPTMDRRMSSQPGFYGQGPPNHHRRMRPNGSLADTNSVNLPSFHGLGIDAMDPSGLGSKAYLPHRKSSMATMDASLKLTPPYSPSPTSGGGGGGMSLVSLASGMSVHPPPFSPMSQIPPHMKPNLRRRGSNESISTVMTETTASVQRRRIEDAVMQCGEYGEHLPDIVDMLMTLKRKDLSLCLFNTDFLKEKIQLALNALDTFDRSDSDNEKEDMDPKPDAFSLKPLKVDSPFFSPTTRMSKAIPIVPPPETVKSTTLHTNNNSNNTNGSIHVNQVDEDIEKLLASMRGKPAHEQKQLLGDRLFPLVKANGTKHAPRVTIQLLDTLDLAQLAREMHDKDILKERIQVAIGTLQK